MKKYARSLLYDKLHRGSVLVCIGLTLYGSVLLGDHFYNYYRYVKPQIEAAKQAAQRELLSEGSADRILQE
ncbi:putative secreted protein [Operophtera brumata]|uniref:Putative secreted protein n=1 Tax=Operophtera brumata TaxID=104452 RepID=A0A0L7K3K2_OPEBR|nr:putative secreted protein [Operophtera brumata]